MANSVYKEFVNSKANMSDDYKFESDETKLNHLNLLIGFDKF